MRIDILTLFPAICEGPLGESMMGRAQQSRLALIQVHDLRKWTTDRHRVTDDAPYGGGPGMVMKPEPIFAAVEELRNDTSKVILLSPQGRVFRQSVAAELAIEAHLILVCGHYEGIDHRVADHLADEFISIGDYVLTNGALAACVVADAVVRLLPGVLGHELSAEQESFQKGLLDCPHYTRPPEFRGWKVPPVLLSGNHAEISRWRASQALALTRRFRPDLLEGSDAQ